MRLGTVAHTAAFAINAGIGAESVMREHRKYVTPQVTAVTAVYIISLPKYFLGLALKTYLNSTYGSTHMHTVTVLMTVPAKIPVAPITRARRTDVTRFTTDSTTGLYLS